MNTYDFGDMIPPLCCNPSCHSRTWKQISLVSHSDGHVCGSHATIVSGITTCSVPPLDLIYCTNCGTVRVWERV